MKFQLDFEVQENAVDVKHGDKVLLLGSCFSDALTPKFEKAGFEVCSNPLGTLFHPLAISSVVHDTLKENYEAKAIQSDGIWYDWRASSKVSGYSKEELEKNIAAAFSNLRDALVSSKVIVITFGTAYGYVHETAGLVGNCHKQPQSDFLLQTNTADTIYSHWEEVIRKVKEVNPKVQFVFTVSPVRHIKDGLIQNNRSKARLLEVCEALEASGAYFPSYEIVNDVLRDYRFFKKDLVHPSEDAVDVVWEYVQKFFFSKETQDIVNRVEGINQMRSHRSIHPESQASKTFKESVDRKMAELSAQYPTIFWQ